MNDELSWLKEGFDLAEILNPAPQKLGIMTDCSHCHEKSHLSDLLCCEHKLCASFYHRKCLKEAVDEIMLENNACEVFCPLCYGRQEEVRRQFIECGIDVGTDNCIFSLQLPANISKTEKRKVEEILSGNCSRDDNRAQVTFLRDQVLGRI